MIEEVFSYLSWILLSVIECTLLIKDCLESFLIQDNFHFLWAVKISEYNLALRLGLIVSEKSPLVRGTDLLKRVDKFLFSGSNTLSLVQIRELDTWDEIWWWPKTLVHNPLWSLDWWISLSVYLPVLGI